MLALMPLSSVETRKTFSEIDLSIEGTADFCGKARKTGGGKGMLT